MKTKIKKWLARAVEIVRYHVAGDTCKLPWRPLRSRCQCGIYPIGWEEKEE